MSDRSPSQFLHGPVPSMTGAAEAPGRGPGRLRAALLAALFVTTASAAEAQQPPVEERKPKPLPSDILARFRIKHQVPWVLSFSSDGKKLALGNDSAQIQVWEIATGKAIFRYQFKAASTYVTDLSFSQDDERIAAAGYVSVKASAPIEKVRVIRLKTGKVLLKDDRFAGSMKPFGVFSPGLRILAEGGGLGTGGSGDPIRLVELATGKELSRIKLAESTVYPWAFSRSGRTLATTSGIETRHLWDVATGKMLCQLPKGEVRLAISPDKESSSISVRAKTTPARIPQAALTARKISTTAKKRKALIPMLLSPVRRQSQMS